MSGSTNSQGNAPEKSYEVGFCKPPRHTQWKKGQSGNPKGRKKREPARNLHDAIVAELSKTMAVTDADGTIVHYNRLELLSNQLVNKAIKGDKTAMGIMTKSFSNIHLPEPEKQKTKEELEIEKKNAILLKMLRACLDKFGDYDLALKKFFEILNMLSPPQ